MYCESRMNRYVAAVFFVPFSLVLISCGGGGGGGTTANSAPTASVVTITDDNAGSAEVGDSLTGSYLYADAESDAEGTSTFRWLRNGVAISGATASTYVLVTADSGKSITFEVTPIASAGTTTGSAVTSGGITVSNGIAATKPLNDSGITGCGDYSFTDSGTSYDVTGSGLADNGLNCAVQPVVPTKTSDGSDTDGDVIRGGQDALYGRDVTNNDNSDGHAGFSFTKLDAAGTPLTDQSAAYSTTPWSCVKDNVTGLIWEVKTTSGLQSNTYTYTWYNSTGINDGGEHGIGDTGIGTSTGFETSAALASGSDNCANTSRCDTEKYVVDVNATNLCGGNTWRLPTKHELLSVVNFNVASISAPTPTIDTNYFPNAQPLSYWSSSPYADSAWITRAWHVRFTDNTVGAASLANSKATLYYVRLVRSN